jgi:hypothetical protein
MPFCIGTKTTQNRRSDLNNVKSAYSREDFESNGKEGEGRPLRHLIRSRRVSVHLWEGYVLPHLLIELACLMTLL